MVANIGYFSLVLAFVVALYGAGAGAYGALRNRPAFVESARHALLLIWPLVTVAALAIITLLVRGDYEVAFVASVTSSTMPVYLRITALWGGQAGSLVFWAWVVGALSSAGGPRQGG